MLNRLSYRLQTLVPLILLCGGIVGQLTAKRQVVRLAYVDPGAGLLALQILGASVMGSYYLLGRKLRSLFRRFKSYRPAGDKQSHL
jgi:hypothetical protein